MNKQFVIISVCHGVKVEINFQSDVMEIRTYEYDDGKYWHYATRNIEYNDIINGVTLYALNHSTEEKFISDMVTDCIKSELDKAFENTADTESRKFLHNHEVIEAIRETIF